MHATGSHIRIVEDDGIIVLTFEDPPVNHMSGEFLETFERTVNDYLNKTSIRAIIVTGREKYFLTGADVNEFPHMRDRGYLLQSVMKTQNFLHRIATASVPVISAINGLCLGLGLEIAMCCHLRIAADSAEFGMPEVKVGLIPGAGGTQRLPRLVGTEMAAAMITSGKTITAKLAREIGLVDEIVEARELLDSSLEWARRCTSGSLQHIIKAAAETAGTRPTSVHGMPGVDSSGGGEKGQRLPGSSQGFGSN